MVDRIFDAADWLPMSGADLILDYIAVMLTVGTLTIYGLLKLDAANQRKGDKQ